MAQGFEYYAWVLATLLLLAGAILEGWRVARDATTAIPADVRIMRKVGPATRNCTGWREEPSFRVPNYMALVDAKSGVTRIWKNERFHISVDVENSHLHLMLQLRLDYEGRNFFEDVRVHGAPYAFIRSAANVVLYALCLPLTPLLWVWPAPFLPLVGIASIWCDILAGFFLFAMAVLQFIITLVALPVTPAQIQ